MRARNFGRRLWQCLALLRNPRKTGAFGRPSVDVLEDRMVLSTIVWTNRGTPSSDTDGFTAAFGANATLARAIVDRAINDWEEVIIDFNYAGGGNSYSLNISASDLGPGSRGSTGGIGIDAQGKPTSATITLDDDGGGAGWFFDGTPMDDAEFTTLLTTYTATGAITGRDFFSTTVHEVGHAMGIATPAGLAINNFMTPAGTDQVGGAAPLFLFTGASVTATLVQLGGRHTYEGPVDPAFPNSPIHPNDLLNAGRASPATGRRLITDLNALILKDAYNYTIQLPSTLNTFHANLNATTGVLTVNGGPGTSNDNIVLDVDGGVRVQVNGTVETFPGATITSINILAGDGNDAVTVGSGLLGIPITANLGSGNDLFNGGDVTVVGGPGNDTIIGGPGNDSLSGDAGNDVIDGQGGNDTLAGGADNDQIYGGTGSNSVSDGTGNDLVDLSENSTAVAYGTGGGNDTVIGTAFNDSLTGGSGTDRLEGRGGNDVLTGGLATDALFGGDDSDTFIVNVGDGTDVIEGESGIDGLNFIGTGGGESIFLGPAGGRLTVTTATNLANAAGVERINVLAAGGSDLVTLADLATTEAAVVSVNLGGADGSLDNLVVHGRATADDLTITSVGSVVQVIGLSHDVNLSGAEVTDGLVANGNDGNDVIKAEPGVESLVGIVLNGGNGNDFLSADATLNGDADNDTLIGGGGNDTINGGDGDDLLDGRGGSNTLDGGSGTDTLLVSGTAGPDGITTTHGVGTFTVVGGPSAGSNFISTLEAVRVEGGDGADQVRLELLTAGGLNYTVLGGHPIGAPGDVLTVSAAGTVTMTVTAGPENDAGSVDAGTTTPTNVSFDEIERLVIDGGGGAVVNGTNGNDAITLIARDDSYNASADGVQDFTTVVNAGLEVLWIDQPSVTINALGGSDTVVVRAPAPNNAVWDVDVTIDGGAPSAGDPAGSDRLVVETPGAAPETVVYTPTAADAGTLGLTSLSSSITFTQMEELLYDGETDNDSLTVVGTAGTDVLRHTPGAANDAGAFQVNGLLPLAYENLGSGATLTMDGGANGVGGPDRFDFSGTGTNDTFTVGAAGQLTLNSRLTVNVTDAAGELLLLEGLAGDDTTTFTPALSAISYSTSYVNGGDQASAAGDKVFLSGTAGADLITASGQMLASGGKTVAASGQEEVRLDALGGSDELTYNGVAGVGEAISVLSSGVAGGGQISVPQVVLLSFTEVELVDVNGNTPTPTDTDTLTVVGTNARDVFEINLAAAATTTDPILKLNTLTAATLLTLRSYTNFATLNTKGLDGEDVFNVSTAASGPSRNVLVDGGSPTGKKKSTDKLNVFYVPPRPRIIHNAETQNPQSGLVDLDYVSARFLVQYADIEQVVIARK